jgi:hypothetical protein
LVGRQAEYDPPSFAKYQQGNAIAVTTYSGIFNSHPKIKGYVLRAETFDADPHVLICDDAHSADSFVSSMWTLRISRYEREAAFMTVVNFLKAVLPENLTHRIQNFDGNALSRSSLDLISTLSLYDELPALRDTLQGVVEDTELIYSWRAISPHLQSCSFYCAPDCLEVRPILSPTLSHKPFADAQQHIYMSATLGDDGDIERCFGVKDIKKLPVQEGWDRRGTGRRLMLFPGIAPLKTQRDAVVKLLQNGCKSLILVPDNRTRDVLAKQLKQGFTILTSADSEEEIEQFRKATPPVVLILANRYDGIDFPGDDCRNMLVHGLPTGASLQELYMIHRLNATSQLRDRIRTRVTQAVGRCTRDEGDYSVVMIDGNDLLKWFCTKENVAGMHPELQAEISFGIENSQDRTTNDFVSLSAALLGQTADWEVGEADLKNRRNACAKKKDMLADVLAKAAKHEIDYIYNLWFGNYPKAYENADAVLSAIGGGDEIRPYRTFWEHQAAVAAFLSWKQGGGDAFKQTAIRRLESASKKQIALNWIGDLLGKLTGSFPQMQETLPIQEWFNQINISLEELGLKGAKFSRRIAVLRASISSVNPDQFHQGLEWLGKFLGATTKRWSSAGAPDGLWLFETWWAAVFEAKTKEFTAGHVTLTTVRQAKTHEFTAKHDKSVANETPTQTVIISPRVTILKDALPHAGDISLVSQNEVVMLFDKAVTALQELRLLAADMTEEQLRAKAVEVYKKNGVYMPQVRTPLTSQRLDSIRPSVDYRTDQSCIYSPEQSRGNGGTLRCSDSSRPERSTI